jgi:predicted metal-dependent hydrolase
MKERIRTLHPEKKQGVNISREKYELIREAIFCVLKTQKEITFMNLSRAVEKEVKGKFDGSVTWYVTTVKLDMEARGEVKRVPNSRPQLVKLA